MFEMSRLGHRNQSLALKFIVVAAIAAQPTKLPSPQPSCAASFPQIRDTQHTSGPAFYERQVEGVMVRVRVFLKKWGLFNFRGSPVGVHEGDSENPDRNFRAEKRELTSDNNFCHRHSMLGRWWRLTSNSDFPSVKQQWCARIFQTTVHNTDDNTEVHNQIIN